MATGDTVMVDDLPPELLDNLSSDIEAYQEQSLSSQATTQNDQIRSHSHSSSWQQALAAWAEESLQTGETDILQTATPEFERVLLTAALNHSGGKKIAAANLLGWGRNTLTRKLQQLDISSEERQKNRY